MNRLANETSPYLRQHADNPVDWFPWGEEAFDTARERDVPIFLSVGYSTCHWCHVMARESFEDDAIAAQMNASFVNIKVDREERPDVDAVYMRAVQALTGHGGWPMSVFLTPDGEPFYGGTYWPPRRAHGMPAFTEVLGAIADAWQEQRDEVTTSARQISTALADAVDAEPGAALDVGVADEAAADVLDNAWDRVHGGFGRAPKFPQAMTIEWLLARFARTREPSTLGAAVQALDAMARGGIHDQLTGGFARYSTDAQWLVPHFEKMLYDNALLLPGYATAAVLMGQTAPAKDDERDIAGELARVAHDTATYLLGELRTADGTFVAATDADSEGVEGRFYVWSYDEVAEVCTEVGANPERWTRYLGVVPEGNWEGVNVLHEPVPRDHFAVQEGLDVGEFEVEWERVRGALAARRSMRVAPAVDDKILTDWNALAIRGLVVAGTHLREPGWIAAATTAAEVLHDQHMVDGNLVHSRAGDRLGSEGFLEDYATLALADLLLYEATGDVVWFRRAQRLAIDAHERFADETDGGWFQTAAGAERLLYRPKETWDNATPAGTSVMIEVCLRLAGLTGEFIWRERAEAAIRCMQEGARRMGTGYGWLLRQLEAVAAERREVAIIGRPGPERDALASVLHERVRPGTITVVAGSDHGDAVPLLAGRGEVDEQPAAYVCRALACERPLTSPDELRALLDQP